MTFLTDSPLVFNLLIKFGYVVLIFSYNYLKFNTIDIIRKISRLKPAYFFPLPSFIAQNEFILLPIIFYLTKIKKSWGGKIMIYFSLF